MPQGDVVDYSRKPRRVFPCGLCELAVGRDSIPAVNLTGLES